MFQSLLMLVIPIPIQISNLKLNCHSKNCLIIHYQCVMNFSAFNDNETYFNLFVMFSNNKL